MIRPSREGRPKQAIKRGQIQAGRQEREDPSRPSRERATQFKNKAVQLTTGISLAYVCLGSDRLVALVKVLFRRRKSSDG